MDGRTKGRKDRQTDRGWKSDPLVLPMLKTGDTKGDLTYIFNYTYVLRNI